MECYSLSHLANDTLLQGLAALLKQDRATTAALLAHLGEVDELRLYVGASYPSMYLYCVHELHMSEDTAFKRIRAARTARQFPAIFGALADGRLNLIGVLLLAARLTPETADELLAAAAHKTHAQIELLLAERFPQPDVPTLVRDLSPAVSPGERAVPPVGEAPQQATWPVAAMVASPLAARARLAPRSPGRFALQLTVGQATHDKLRYAQALLGHALPSGDVEAVLERALDALVDKLERQKFARSARSRPGHGSAKGRYIPAEVRRTVWQRDGGRCTFVSESGKRCASTTRLEFDHVDPVARGGQTTVDRMRLRCRAHNQYAAECAFGAGFMRGKRQEARCRSEQARAKAKGCVRVQAPTEPADEPAINLDVRPWLRQLGFSAEEARRGAAQCAQIPDASIETRVRIALRGLAPNCVRRAAPVASGTS